MSGPGFNPFHPADCGCRKCAVRRAGAGLHDRTARRESIPRSHRAEGRNFID